MFRVWVVCLVLGLLSFGCCEQEIDHVDASFGNIHHEEVFDNIHENTGHWEQENLDSPLMKFSKGGHSVVIEDLSILDHEILYHNLYGWLAAEGTTAAPALSIGK